MALRVIPRYRRGTFGQFRHSRFLDQRHGGLNENVGCWDFKPGNFTNCIAGTSRKNECKPQPFGLKGISVVHLTTNVTKRHSKEFDGHEYKKDLDNKHKGAEESRKGCERAVESLSVAKAKAKDKQLDVESARTSKSVFEMVWIKICGTGPSLKAIASMSRTEWDMKIHDWIIELKSTFRRYWLGLKLLTTDIRISFSLLMKLASGKNFSRMERQQLTRTTADIFRLVPFAAFVLVPFMEFLLPVFLKIFPKMLPSTFKDEMKEQEALRKQLKVRIEFAKFLQDTIKEMEKELQSSHVKEMNQVAHHLDNFLNQNEERKADIDDEPNIKRHGSHREHVALKELSFLTSTVAEDLVKAKALEKQEELCNISRALSILASASSVNTERQEFLSLVNKEIDLYNSMLEKESRKGEDAKKLYTVYRQKSDDPNNMTADKVSSALKEKVDSMLQKLGKEIDDSDAVIGRQLKPLDSDYDGKGTAEEVAVAAMHLKETLDKLSIAQVISTLATDEEGKILVEDVIKLGCRKECKNEDEAKSC